jgi:hypothetical protein
MGIIVSARCHVQCQHVATQGLYAEGHCVQTASVQDTNGPTILWCITCSQKNISLSTHNNHCNTMTHPINVHHHPACPCSNLQAHPFPSLAAPSSETVVICYSSAHQFQPLERGLCLTLIQCLLLPEARLAVGQTPEVAGAATELLHACCRLSPHLLFPLCWLAPCCARRPCGFVGMPLCTHPLAEEGPTNTSELLRRV